MELWIISQNKGYLYKAEQIEITKYDKYFDVEVNGVPFGEYKSTKRAEQILDEIKQLIKNQYIVECNPMLDKANFCNLKKYFTDNYSGEFILQPLSTEIHPINSNVVVYEMPKE